MSTMGVDELLVAVWEDGMYCVVRKGWLSDDGDWWTTLSGEPLRGEEFERATIRLVGGPRDGQIVG